MGSVLYNLKDMASVIALMISMISLCISVLSYSRGNEKRVAEVRLNESRYGLFYPTSVLYETAVMAFSSDLEGFSGDKNFLCLSLKGSSKIVYDKLISAISLGFANEIILSEVDRIILSGVVSSLIQMTDSDVTTIEVEKLYTKQNFLYGLLWIMNSIIRVSPSITSAEYSKKIARNYAVMSDLVKKPGALP